MWLLSASRAGKDAELCRHMSMCRSRAHGRFLTHLQAWFASIVCCAQSQDPFGLSVDEAFLAVASGTRTSECNRGTSCPNPNVWLPDFVDLQEVSPTFCRDKRAGRCCDMEVVL